MHQAKPLNYPILLLLGINTESLSFFLSLLYLLFPLFVAPSFPLCFA